MQGQRPPDGHNRLVMLRCTGGEGEEDGAGLSKASGRLNEDFSGNR